MEDSAEGAGDINARLANRRRGKGTGNPGKPGKKLRLADLQSQFGVGLKVSSCHFVASCVTVSPSAEICKKRAGTCTESCMDWCVKITMISWQFCKAAC